MKFWKRRKRSAWLLTGMVVLLSGLTSCGTTAAETAQREAEISEEQTTLIYGSGDYTRINPAMDEHGEINLLLFNGLTAHNGENEVVPGLAKSWEFDAGTCTYIFHLEEGVQWHDGEPLTAEDVKFTIEAIMDPQNGSENAPNYEDVEEITVVDDTTVTFRLSAPNVAFLDYMTMAVLPKHLLEGEDMQESAFFRAPVGTGPYRLESWEAGQAIVLAKNETYFRGEPY
ncbi:MAG: ABC transporter substrate-binding protein, partial [Lachnospiraceae bacterium]|nr:ABC transporter substrate-binding protein [Lachnospiraceae bacterium]